MLGALLAALFALPAPAHAADMVARVERTGVEYESFDEAFKAAEAGDTITLLSDAEIGTSGTASLNKSITIDGQGQYTLDSVNHRYGLSYGGSLTFRNITANFSYTIEIENPTYSSDLGLFYINGQNPNQDDTFDFTFENATINLTNGDPETGAAGASNRLHGFYYDSCGGTIALTNSNLNVTGFPEDAIEWGGQANSYITMDGSTFVSESNRSGITGTWNVTTSNETTIEILNSTGNATNGSNFDLTDSTVTINNNVGHGLSAGKLLVKNTDITTDHNGYYGVYMNNLFRVDGESTLTVTRNNWGTIDCAGLKVPVSAADDPAIDGLIESGAVVTLTDNYNSGLSNNRTLVIEEGVDLTITGNNNYRGSGGGVYSATNSGRNTTANLTLPSDSVIYNNHAKNAGDDIYTNANSTITFGGTEDSWELDGQILDTANMAESIWLDDGCTDPIDGWYCDGLDLDGASSARWEAHADDPANNYVVLQRVVGDTVTLTGAHALKAAHGITATIEPADITIYMGGTDGYESVVDSESGENISTSESNSLPEPGFYIDLPECINNQLQAAQGGDPAATDLSHIITIRTADGSRTWKLERYGATASVAYNRFIYRIVPAGENQMPVRLQFTSGDQFFVSDEFDPSLAGALSEQYTMGIYPGEVDVQNVIMSVEVDDATYDYPVELETGVLNIRYVTGEQADVVTDVVNTADELAQLRAENPTKAYAVMPEDTSYYINESSVDVTSEAAPSLLFDEVVSDENTEGAAAYDEQLASRAVTVAEQQGASFENLRYEARYLDLVDANNGNTWLKASEPVTVYWPYPAGTDENTDFYLVHAEGLHREMANGDIAGSIDAATMSPVEVETTPNGIRFTTDGFSPFVLMWDATDEPVVEPPTDEPPATEDKKPDTGSLVGTGDSTTLVVAGIGLAGAVCLGTALVLKKRTR